MALPTTTTARDTLLEDLEDLWTRLDTILDGLGPTDWTRRHGKDWIYADLPYHLSYFDRDLVADSIARGASVPADEQLFMRSEQELNDWNGRQFAERPAGRTVAESLAQMRASRQAIRELVGGMSDADLARPAWMALPGGGWRPARDLLDICIVHTWAHFVELRLRLKRMTPEPRPSQTHRALAFYTSMLPLVFDAERAGTARFTLVMDFSGPGGGAWTVQVADGVCQVREGRAEAADLVLTQSPETFVAIRVGLQNPMLGMLAGKIKVRGLRSMPTFGKLFPQPKPDTILTSRPLGAPAAG